MPKEHIDSGHSIAYKSNELTIIYYKHAFDKNGNFDGVMKDSIDDELNQFYLLINDTGLSIVVFNSDGIQYPRFNAIKPIISLDHKNDLLIEAVFHGMPYHGAKIKIEFNTPPIHPLQLNNLFVTISILEGGAFSNNKPIPESQYVLKDIKYIGRVDTKFDL